MSTYLFATESMMAIRQACIMADLGRSEIEKLFYRNAASLFGDV